MVTQLSQSKSDSVVSIGGRLRTFGSLQGLPTELWSIYYLPVQRVLLHDVERMIDIAEGCARRLLFWLRLDAP